MHRFLSVVCRLSVDRTWSKRGKITHLSVVCLSGLDQKSSQKDNKSYLRKYHSMAYIHSQGNLAMTGLIANVKLHFLHGFTKLAVSWLIMVWFEKFKIWHARGSDADLSDVTIMREMTSRAREDVSSENNHFLMCGRYGMLLWAYLITKGCISFIFIRQTDMTKKASQNAYLRLPWVWIRTFGPIELGIWVWPESYRTRTLESQFDTSPSTENLRPQSLKWTGLLVGAGLSKFFSIPLVLGLVWRRVGKSGGITGKSCFMRKSRPPPLNNQGTIYNLSSV